MDIVVKATDLRSAAAQSLVDALNAELSALYPEQDASHFRVDPEEVAGNRGAFVIAWSGDRPVGCGAVRRLDDRTGEIKRMYVVPANRGHGISRLVLARLEAEARRLGCSRLQLETGARQTAAIALYTRSGYAEIPRFGEYKASAMSVCMEKALA